MSVKDVRVELESGRGNPPESLRSSNDAQYWAALCEGARAIGSTAPATDSAAALRSAETALAKARQARSRTLFEVQPRQAASDPRRDPSFTAALARNGAVFNLRGRV